MFIPEKELHNFHIFSINLFTLVIYIFIESIKEKNKNSSYSKNLLYKKISLKDSFH